MWPRELIWLRMISSMIISYGPMIGTSDFRFIWGSVSFRVARAIHTIAILDQWYLVLRAEQHVNSASSLIFRPCTPLKFLATGSQIDEVVWNSGSPWISRWNINLGGHWRPCRWVTLRSWSFVLSLLGAWRKAIEKTDLEWWSPSRWMAQTVVLRDETMSLN